MSDQFFKTEFIKEDSIQDSQLQHLKNNPYANKEGIHMLEMGISGEKQVMYHLKKSNIGMYALRDVFLTCDGFNAQIDFILITSHHCYIVECKNYSADIVNVDETGNFTLSTRYGKKYNRKGIKSPLSQADEQLNVFQKICLNNQEEVKSLLNGIKFKDYFKTMTVFTNQENILNLKKASKDIKYRVLKVDNLVRQIEYDDSHYKGKRLTASEMKEIASFILKNHSERKDYIIDRPIYTVSQNEITQINNKNNIGSIIGYIVIGLIILGLFLAIIIGFARNVINNNRSINNSRHPIVNNSKRLTENQIQAISILKSGYEGSKTNGFELIHTSVCREISGLTNNRLSCAGNPLIVNIENNSISIFHTFTCYRITISDDNKLISSTQKYLGYDTEKVCSGLPIGIVEWDSDNEYFNKIGGYNKIREISIGIYRDNKTVNDYCDYNHIEERGGNRQLWSTYKMDVDSFFKGVTGKGPNAYSDTTKKEFEEMVKNYYYIMK